MAMRTALADALHQRGKIAEARAGFIEAESMQAQWPPQYPLLTSLGGFRYCDLLLAGAERIAAHGAMQLHLADCALYRARLLRDRAALAQARRLIDDCGYGRRLPELEDAEAAAESWYAQP